MDPTVAAFPPRLAVVLFLAGAMLGAAAAPAQDRSPAEVPAEERADARAVPLEELRSLAEQNFGTVLHTTTIGAADFRPVDSTTTWLFDSDGHIHRTGGGSAFWAPIHLDPGSQIENICLHAYDTAAAAGILFDVGAYELDASGTPGFALVLSANYDGSGYYAVCFDNTNHIVTSIANPDGDGSPGQLAYRAVVYLAASDNTQRLGGITLLWRRIVYPSPFVAYTDVPAELYDAVTAITAAGISSGCAPSRFCPNLPVTRGQMALFLARALGLYTP